MIGKMKMHEEYLPTTKEAAEARIAEECAEVLMAYAKMQRFGRDKQPPWKGPRNEDQFNFELKDLSDALSRYMNGDYKP